MECRLKRNRKKKVRREREAERGRTFDRSAYNVNESETKREARRTGVARRESGTNKLSESEKRRKGRLGSRRGNEWKGIIPPRAVPVQRKAGPFCAGEVCAQLPQQPSHCVSLSAQ